MTPTPEDIAPLPTFGQQGTVYEVYEFFALPTGEMANLRELAEIGRLAVEDYQNATLESRVDLHRAVFAYVNKEPKL